MAFSDPPLRHHGFRSTPVPSWLFQIRSAPSWVFLICPCAILDFSDLPLRHLGFFRPAPHPCAIYDFSELPQRHLGFFKSTPGPSWIFQIRTRAILDFSDPPLHHLGFFRSAPAPSWIFPICPCTILDFSDLPLRHLGFFISAPAPSWFFRSAPALSWIFQIRPRGKTAADRHREYFTKHISCYSGKKLKWLYLNDCVIRRKFAAIILFLDKLFVIFFHVSVACQGWEERGGRTEHWYTAGATTRIRWYCTVWMYISNHKRIALLFQSFVKSDVNESLTVAL